MKVQLLVTCLVDSLFPDVGFSVVNVLERLGVEVEVPAGQTCCGQPAFNAGSPDDARAMARHLIDVFGASDLPVVVPSGSCGDMVIHHAPALLSDDPAYAERARKLAGRTHEFTAFLVDVLGVKDMGAVAHNRVAYHAACHGLRGLGLVHQPGVLLDSINGIQRCLLDDEDTCCGFGGLFSVKMPEISGSLLSRKIASIERSGADTVVATDVSCLMHIAGGLKRRGSTVQIKHLAEMLDQPAQRRATSDE